jgi:hypothetical protein
VRQRRAYIGRPADYIREILGYTLTAEQEEALVLMESQARLLIASANNQGKTFLLACYAVYCMDVVGEQLDEHGNPQGARILLPGPDHATVFATVYSEMMAHISRAGQRGFAMPGRYSEDSVLWRVKPQWEVEAFSPPARVNQAVAHTASGRHHRNMLALMEECMGIGERLWRATEGMCSSAGNKIIGSGNPTESSGPAYQRAHGGNYKVLHMDAFDHPNVRTRSLVVPAAIDYRVVDGRVRECRDRGAYPAVQPDLNFADFVYALPERSWDEEGPRADGVPGHPRAELHVYRPTPAFQAQVRGQFPKDSDTSLFSPGALDAAMERWRQGQDPDRIPDRIGVDAAREGADETCFGPSWGEDADVLLRAYAQATEDENARLLAELRGERRIRVGEAQIAPKGVGPDVAMHIARHFPRSPWMVDEGGVGASVLDHAAKVLGIDAHGVSFGAGAPPRLPGEYWCANARAALYARAAMLVERGLVDVPSDPLLREELLAHEIEWTYFSLVEDDRRSPQFGKKIRKAAVLIQEKAEIKKKIGRSPDRADFFVLSLWGGAKRARRVHV